MLYLLFVCRCSCVYRARVVTRCHICHVCAFLFRRSAVEWDFRICVLFLFKRKLVVKNHRFDPKTNPGEFICLAATRHKEHQQI